MLAGNVNDLIGRGPVVVDPVLAPPAVEAKNRRLQAAELDAAVEAHQGSFAGRSSCKDSKSGSGQLGLANLHHLFLVRVLLQRSLANGDFRRLMKRENFLSHVEKFFVEQDVRNLGRLVKLDPHEGGLLGRDHDSFGELSHQQRREVRVGEDEIRTRELAFVVNVADQNSASDLEIPTRSNFLSVAVE